MIEVWDEKIKFPKMPKEYSQDEDYEDLLVDAVLTH
jgi:hypothetical protein